MQSSLPPKPVFKRKPVRATEPLAQEWKYNDGNVLARDDDLGDGAARWSSRSDYEERVHAEVRARGRPHPRERADTLVETILSALAWSLATNERSGPDARTAWERLNDSDRLPAQHALSLLEKVYALCQPPRQVYATSSAPTATGAPFYLWLRLLDDYLLSCAPAHSSTEDSNVLPSHLRTFRGLVFADVEQLARVDDFARYHRSLETPAMPFVVLLDLSGTRLTDADCCRLKVGVGQTVVALRLDRTSVTTHGVRTLARSADDGIGSFSRLQLLSLQGLVALTDAFMPTLVAFPSLAAIDMSGTACSDAGFRLLQIAINGQEQRRHFHRADTRELPVFAASLSLSSAYTRLRRVLGAKDARPAQVLVRRMHRPDPIRPLVGQASADDASVVRNTHGHGDIYGSVRLSHAMVAEDDEATRRQHPSFRVRDGGSVAGANVVEFADRLEDQVSDSDEPVEDEGADPFYGTTKTARATVPAPNPLILFRSVPLQIVYVPPRQTTKLVETAPLKPMGVVKQERKPYAEPVLPRKTSLKRDADTMLQELGILPVAPSSKPSKPASTSRSLPPLSSSLPELKKSKSARRGLASLSRKNSGFSAQRSSYSQQQP